MQNAVYLNNGNRTFTNVAPQAGLEHQGWDFGCTSGDFDNDGYLDIFIAGLEDHRNGVLFHKNGDGTFSDITGTAGVAGAGANARSAASADYDIDGQLDFYGAVDVCNSIGRCQHLARDAASVVPAL